ncbi:MAG: Uncharacterized protein XD43_0462 [Thermococcales archaeon 44_46]|jgi:hypothetical protein|nr:MAG: Uncharacterized protein XD43_0462 [Thermococcales archaeon 44_46]MDK2853638.1 hypothetical protein [Thermococcaceae archaeon]HIH72716.1 hypothetical protein [Thermococcaceae archaeon]
MGKESCKDRWERLSETLSSLSISLLGTILFVLVISYFTLKGLGNAKITVPIQGVNVEITYPEMKLPIDFDALYRVIILLFGTVLIGIPIPLLPENMKALKGGVALIQVAVFTYAFYSFIAIILELIKALA